MSSLGPAVVISNNAVANDLPVMAPVAGKMAITWNESASTGQLFRALMNEDGSFALSPGSIASEISAKAMISSPAGGALLVGTVYTDSKYQLIGQRLDTTLHPVGGPLPLDAASTSDATGVQMHPSPDGDYVLLTYQQGGAKYRIMGSNFCFNQ